MKNFLFMFCVLALASCGKNGQDGARGLDGAASLGVNGADGISNGVDFADIGPGLACASGGVSIFTFRDKNSDGILQDEEQIIKVKALCHGQNGTNGADGSSASITLESIPSNQACPTGGVRISSGSSSPVIICNGKSGLNGAQGIQGVQGIPGIAGANGSNGHDGLDGAPGTNVIPVKFCPKDESAFPEYGLMVGKELFAVYWGTTPASPKVEQAFLTKLVAGNYQSTGGDNCLFAID